MNQHAKKLSSSLWPELGLVSTHSQITSSLTNSLEFEEDNDIEEEQDGDNMHRKRSEYRIKVDIRGNVTDELLEFIEQSGGKVIYASKEFDSIRAAITSKLIDYLSRREDVDSISNAAKAHKYKLNTSQGVTDQRVNVAHAAALAALIFSAAPSISLANLRNVLMTSAVDVGPKGKDDSSGVGVLDAVLIYQNLEPYLSSSKPTTTPSGPCSSNPCKNGATCTAANGDFTCKCKAGFKGKLCANKDDSQSPCASNPCKNGATCTVSGNSFTCKCATGFQGKLCANKTPCSSNPCKNGATCVDETNSFTCKCPAGFSGSLCGTKDQGNTATTLPYKITVKTNPYSGSGTTNQISMKLIGANKQTAQFIFKKGIADGASFTLDRTMVNILPIQSAYISLDPATDSWAFDSISVKVGTQTYSLKGTRTLVSSATFPLSLE